MIGGGFFRGTSHDQDSRFANKQQKLKKSMKFPPEFDQPVDLKKVNLEAIKPWIQRRLTEILGFEDEVVIGLVVNVLENKEEQPDPRDLQINLTGFLAKKSKDFVLELWKHLLAAMEQPQGIPAYMIAEATKILAMRKAQNDQNANAIQRAAQMQNANTTSLSSGCDGFLLRIFLNCSFIYFLWFCIGIEAYNLRTTAKQ